MRERTDPDLWIGVQGKGSADWRRVLEGYCGLGISKFLRVPCKNRITSANIPNICVQPDIFHELRPVGAEMARLERRAEKLISDETILEKRACGKQPQKKTLERLEQIHEKVDTAIQEYDLLRILFCWLVELMGFSGYSFHDACSLVGSAHTSAVPSRFCSPIQ